MNRLRILALLCVAQLLGMSLWFSSSAMVPALRSEWRLHDAGAAWLTLAVQLGFVAGTLLSALVNLPDIVRLRHLVALSMICAAAANAWIGLFARGAAAALLLRFLTGFFLAGMYPPGMKLIATWFREGRGAAIGTLVGALTVGKGFPYLVNAVGSTNWRTNNAALSLAALAGALIILLFVSEGPHAPPLARFDLRQVTAVFRDRALRLASFGYFGHMWELYAMWTWMPAMIRDSMALRHRPPELAEAVSFLVIGSGAIGCVLAGLAADRLGRTRITAGAMAVSGACCLAVGMCYGSHPALLAALAVLWGISVVADSAQFSACVTELGDPRYTGTALTLQTSIGFLLTTVSVRLLPALRHAVGWRYAYLAIAPGPALGALSMIRLRSLPESARIALGKK